MMGSGRVICQFISPGNLYDHSSSPDGRSSQSHLPPTNTRSVRHHRHSQPNEEANERERVSSRYRSSCICFSSKLIPALSIVLVILIAHTLPKGHARALPHPRFKRAFSYLANETACTVDNIVYLEGDSIPTDDPCEQCKCRPPGFSCMLRECTLKPGCRALRREGSCCPEYQCGCEHNGRIYSDGDRIENAESPCYSCYCQGSSITCALADCKFRFDCEPEYVAGECCPRYDHCPPEPIYEEDPGPSSPNSIIIQVTSPAQALSTAVTLSQMFTKTTSWESVYSDRPSSTSTTASTSTTTEASASTGRNPIQMTTESRLSNEDSSETPVEAVSENRIPQATTAPSESDSSSSVEESDESSSPSESTTALTTSTSSRPESSSSSEDENGEAPVMKEDNDSHISDTTEEVATIQSTGSIFIDDTRREAETTSSPQNTKEEMTSSSLETNEEDKVSSSSGESWEMETNNGEEMNITGSVEDDEAQRTTETTTSEPRSQYDDDDADDADGNLRKGQSTTATLDGELEETPSSTTSSSLFISSSPSPSFTEEMDNELNISSLSTTEGTPLWTSFSATSTPQSININNDENLEDSNDSKEEKATTTAINNGIQEASEEESSEQNDYSATTSNSINEQSMSATKIGMPPNESEDQDQPEVTTEMRETSDESESEEDAESSESGQSNVQNTPRPESLSSDSSSNEKVGSEEFSTNRPKEADPTSPGPGESSEESLDNSRDEIEEPIVVAVNLPPEEKGEVTGTLPVEENDRVVINLRESLTTLNPPLAASNSESALEGDDNDNSAQEGSSSSSSKPSAEEIEETTTMSSEGSQLSKSNSDTSQPTNASNEPSSSIESQEDDEGIESTTVTYEENGSGQSSTPPPINKSVNRQMESGEEGSGESGTSEDDVTTTNSPNEAEMKTTRMVIDTENTQSLVSNASNISSTPLPVVSQSVQDEERLIVLLDSSNQTTGPATAPSLREDGLEGEIGGFEKLDKVPEDQMEMTESPPVWS